MIGYVLVKVATHGEGVNLQDSANEVIHMSTCVETQHHTIVQAIPATVNKLVEVIELLLLEHPDDELPDTNKFMDACMYSTCLIGELSRKCQYCGEGNRGDICTGCNAPIND